MPLAEIDTEEVAPVNLKNTGHGPSNVALNVTIPAIP
jgi:hypothetical protein